MIRAKLVYAVLLVILVLFFILYRGVLSLQLLVFGLIFPLTVRILLTVQRLGISVRLNKPDAPACKGEPFEWVIRISSNSRIPTAYAVLELEYSSSMTARAQQLMLELPVTGEKTQYLRLKFRTVTSGTMSLRLKSLTVYDVFRLFSSKLRLNTQQQVFILPAVPQFFEEWEPDISVSDDNSEFSKVKPGDDPSEIFDLHQYREGDLISRVHWKLSSKLDDLMVKEYSLPVAKQYRLVPDHRFCGQTEAESALRLDAAASLMRLAAQKLMDLQLPVLLCSLTAGQAEASEIPAAGEAELREGFAALLGNPPVPEHDLHAAAYLGELQTDEHCSDSLLFFTPRLDDAVINLLTALPRPELLTVFAVQNGEKLPEDLPFRVMGAPLDLLLPPWELDYLSGNGAFPEGGAMEA